jgi:hypothetical protein
MKERREREKEKKKRGKEGNGLNQSSNSLLPLTKVAPPLKANHKFGRFLMRF